MQMMGLDEESARGQEKTGKSSLLKKRDFGGEGGSAERRFCHEKPSLIIVNIVAQVKFGEWAGKGGERRVLASWRSSAGPV